MKTIGYVLADFPVFSETFVGDEIRAVRRLGRKVVPIVMNLRTGKAQAQDLELAREAAVLGAQPAVAAFRALARARGSAAAALSFLRRQSRLPVRSLLWNGLKIADVARRHGCTHLHAHFAGGAAAHAIVAARLAGLSVSFVCHGHDVYAEAEDLELKLACADFVVAVCNDMASDLARLAPKASIVTAPCGIDEESLAPRRDAPGNGRLLFVGRIVEQKGVDDLLRALAEIPVAEIDIIGDGPLAPVYKQEAERLGLAGRVHFLGPRPREWLRENGPSYMGLVAPFKIAPDGARDSGPMVVKEAMAMGLPVVSTSLMGVKETVTPDSGFLSAPGDPASLAESIRALLAMPQTARLRMGEMGRERVAQLFTQRIQAQTLAAAFEAA